MPAIDETTGALIDQSNAKVSQSSIWTMVAINAGFALVVFAMWHHLSPVLGDGLEAAAGGAVDPSDNYNPLSYPFILLWALPLSAGFCCWLAGTLGHWRVARLAGMFPILLLSLGVLWYRTDGLFALFT